MSVRVSILIMTYNRRWLSQKYIEHTLRNMGPISHEILIWDNGSVDGTWDWLRQYARTQPQIKFIHSSNHNYGVEAINFLAEKAKGHYIIKVDDDVVVPRNFAVRLVSAFEELKEPKLGYLCWDIKWGQKTFATRSGMGEFAPPKGTIRPLRSGERVLISFQPHKLVICGMCRMCKKETFIRLGGHPKGVVYGSDAYVSQKAARYKRWVGYLNAADLLMHKGGDNEDPGYRKFKDAQLKKFKNPKHV